MNKRWLIFSGGAVALIIAAFITYIVIANQFKPEKTVDTFHQAIEDDDADTLKELIHSDEKDVAINKESLTAFINYLKANNESYQVIKEGLNKQIDKEDFTSAALQINLFEDGKALGIFPTYKLKVTTVNLNVKGLEDGDKIILDMEGQKKPLEKIDEKKDIYGPILPGEYNIEATIQNNLGSFSKEKKTDVWGSTDVSFLIDQEKLARDSEDIQKDLINAANEFNENLSVYVTSGFDINEFMNITDDLKENLNLLDNNFKLMEDYIEEIESQFLKSIVKMDEIDLIHFDGDWQAEVTMLVSYKERIKFEEADFEDLSYTELRNFILIYDLDNKKWIIDDFSGEKADESDTDDWDHKEEINIDDPPLRRWSKDGSFI